jgi:hypothetical protein
MTQLDRLVRDFVAVQHVKRARSLRTLLKGEKLSDLTVQEPTKFALAVNLTTAKLLGLMGSSLHKAGQ